MMKKALSPRAQSLPLLGVTIIAVLVSASLAAESLSGSSGIWQSAITLAKKTFGVEETPMKETTQTSMGFEKINIEGERPDRSGSDAEASVPQPHTATGIGEGRGRGHSGSGQALSSSVASASKALMMKTATPTPSSTPAPEKTPTVGGPTLTPTHDATSSPTPTNTPSQQERVLSLSSAEVPPGGKFVVALSCDDFGGVAGCDFVVEFPSGLVDVVTINKTGLTDPFLLVKRTTDGRIALSLATTEGSIAGGGALLTFEGVASGSTAADSFVPFLFSRAQMYDQESESLPLVTQGGGIAIRKTVESGNEAVIPSQPPEEDPTRRIESESSQPTQAPEPEAEPTRLSENLVEDNLNPGNETDLSTTEQLPIVDNPVVVPISSPSNTPTPNSFQATVTLETDMNGDGLVDYEDLFVFITYWKQASSE